MGENQNYFDDKSVYTQDTATPRQKKKKKDKKKKKNFTFTRMISQDQGRLEPLNACAHIKMGLLKYSL